MTQYYPSAPITFGQSHTHTIGTPYNDLQPWVLPGATPKEPEMTAAQKIAKERKEKAELVKAETLYAAWDEYNLNGYDVGTAWGVAFARDGKIIFAGFVRTDQNRWDTTNGVRGVELEDLLAWLVENGASPEDLT